MAHTRSGAWCHHPLGARPLDLLGAGAAFELFGVPPCATAGKGALPPMSIAQRIAAMKRRYHCFACNLTHEFAAFLHHLTYPKHKRMVQHLLDQM